MGAWGAGLYSGDIAADLKQVIAAVARLPFAADELLAILEQENAVIAADPQDEDHSTFWLVLADRFAKLGVDCPRARAKALAIIDDGVDLAMMAALDMAPADLKKRRAMLDELRPTIARYEPPKKPRAVLRQPQPFLMELGDCLVFPVSKGQGVNAYFPVKEKDTTWKQDGWGAGVLAERGRAFGYLAWYRLAVVGKSFPAPPDLATIRASRLGPGLSAGACSPVHFKRMELVKIGSLSVDPTALHRLVPELAQARSGDKNAILDVSICGNLRAASVRGFKGPLVSEILAG